jgi:hypothetical protein
MLSLLLWLLVVVAQPAAISSFHAHGGGGRARWSVAAKGPPPSLRHIRSSITRLRNRVTPTMAAVATNDWWIWSALAASSSAGLVLEKTKVGAALSANLVTMAATLVLCNTGIIPSSSAVYATVMKTFVPLAVPLLLLDADLRKCLKTTGTLMQAFLVGAVGTLVGTVVAYMLVPMRSIVGSHKIAAALCARHIGGAVNFVAVSDILKTRPDAVAAALAADNVVVAVYFAFLFLITTAAADVPTPGAPLVKASLGSIGPVNINVEASLAPPDAAGTGLTNGGASDGRGAVNVQTLSAATALGFLLCATSESVGKMLAVSPTLLVSGAAVFAATAFPRVVGAVAPAGSTVGILLMQFFFAVTGAMGYIPTVMRMAPSLFLHAVVQIAVHFAVSASLGRYLKLPFREICLASNANVGGPTTAAGMASAKKWKDLVLPALLTGIFGYAIATVLGVAIAKLLVHLPTL